MSFMTPSGTPRIKLVVDTGFVDCQHVEYITLPSNWNSLSELDRERFIQHNADKLRNETCGAFGTLLED